LKKTEAQNGKGQEQGELRGVKKTGKIDSQRSKGGQNFKWHIQKVDERHRKVGPRRLRMDDKKKAKKKKQTQRCCTQC